MNDAAATTFLILILKHAPSSLGGATLVTRVQANCVLVSASGHRLRNSTTAGLISLQLILLICGDQGVKRLAFGRSTREPTWSITYQFSPRFFRFSFFAALYRTISPRDRLTCCGGPWAYSRSAWARSPKASMPFSAGPSGTPRFGTSSVPCWVGTRWPREPSTC